MDEPPWFNRPLHEEVLSPELKILVQKLSEELCRRLGGHSWANRDKGRWRCFVCQKVRRVRKKRRAKLQGCKTSAVIIDEWKSE